jgi:hypothetical protein
MTNLTETTIQGKTEIRPTLYGKRFEKTAGKREGKKNPSAATGNFRKGAVEIEQTVSRKHADNTNSPLAPVCLPIASRGQVQK